MKDGWIVGQDDELLFRVPLEHRKVLRLPHVEATGDRPVKVDLSRFRYGSKWTECIDQPWLERLEEREKRLLEYEDSCIFLSTITILPCIYISHSHERFSWTAAYSIFLRQYRNPMIIIPALRSFMPPFLADFFKCFDTDSDS